MIALTRVKWLKNRLASMGPKEVSSRLADVGRHVMLRALRHRIQNLRHGQSNGMDHQPNAPIMHVAMADTPVKKQMIEIAYADRWLSHRARFFSLEDVPLGDPIDWQRDYASGTRGPMKYSGLIDHRNSAVIGDVKYIWELNRLQHLVVFGLAFRETENVAYRDEIVRQTLAWSASNPFMMGVNWKSPLEAALRLISWACVLCLVGDQFPSGFYDKLQATVYQHQYFIQKFYSKHSSANNHLIGEMTGLYVASVIWPHYRETGSWRKLARKSLIGEITRQVESDGVGKELSTEYQLFILEFLLMAAALGQITGDTFPQLFWQRLSSMSNFLSAISDCKGNFPMFGDGDSGQVVAIPDTIQARAQSLERLVRRHSESIVDPGSDTRTRLLLWGRRPENFPFTPESEKKPGLRPFPQGGYYVLADGQDDSDEMIAVFDAGALGLPPLYAHGHADALSFWLSYRGQEFLVDPGTFCYYGHELWRDYFRSTAAHNTMRIDGQDQSVPCGRFQWSHAARAQVLQAQETDEWIEVEACHDGYMRLSDPVTHYRSLRLFKRSKALIITDRLSCNRGHDVEIYFHLHEDCRVERTGNQSFIAEVETVRLRMSLDARLEYELAHGSEQPIRGWISRKYGVKTPSMTIVGKGRLNGSQKLVTEIVPQ